MRRERLILTNRQVNASYQSYGPGLRAHTDALLGTAPAFPLWNLAVLPVAFLASAAYTGYAVALLAARLAPWDERFAGPDARQRFYDRVLVGASPLFVPLSESCVLGAADEGDGAVRWGSVESRRTDHVAACYAAAGFDPRTLEGFSPAISALRPDSLAAELAFLSLLKAREAAAWRAAGDAESASGADAAGAADVAASAEDAAGQGRRWAALARQFAAEHPARWARGAAGRLAAGDDDLYAALVRCAADLAETLAED